MIPELVGKMCRIPVPTKQHGKKGQSSGHLAHAVANQKMSQQNIELGILTNWYNADVDGFEEELLVSQPSEIK